MRLRTPGLWLGIASALLVAVLVWSDRGRASPGPVSPTHAQETKLAQNGCDACHGTGSGGMAGACSACHADVRAEIESTRGLHGTLAAGAERCGACHVEHHGSEIALVAERSFALAGYEKRSDYDHRGLDYRLAGRHAALACAECHPNADVPLLRAGTKRFLGLDASCTRCHEDVHGGKLPDCAACHGEEHPFARVANFVHTDGFPLTGAHAKPACKDCHPKEGPRSIENDGKAGATSVRACERCHASPHAAGFVAAIAAELGRRPEASCVACHPPTQASFIGQDALLTKAQHAASGFALAAPHDRVSCEACHPPASKSFRDAHPGRAIEACEACHEDPHAGQFRSGLFAGKGCLACHERSRFAPPAFDIAAHANTSFPLEGSHAAVPCAACHAGSTPLPEKPGRVARLFHGTSAACSSCHVNAHGAAFDRASDDRPTSCAACHGTGSFSELAVEFDHAPWTGFELEGAHATVACEACHPRAAQADTAGRRFGRAVAGATPERCSLCHADPHAGAFDRPVAPKRVDGRVECARCHTTETFGGAETGFDHARWTGYALEGAHAALACARCHATTGAPDAGPARLAPARGTDCAACHEDVHVGQFAVEGRTDCGRCHASQSSFKDVRFDHDRDSRFRLDEGHRRLACSACHLRMALEGGGAAVRYKPLGTACADCHDARRERPR